MAFVPSVMTLNEYFPEKFVFMNTVAMYGYTVGSALLPVIAEQAVQAYGYTGAFIILGGISFNVVVCGATLRKSSRNIVTNAQGEPPSRGRGGERTFDERCSISAQFRDDLSRW